MQRNLALALFLTVALNIAGPVNSQEILKIDVSCSYDGQALPADLYGFESNAEAEQAVKRILDNTGLNQNFTIRAANVNNAAAAIQGQQRMILYSQDFMIRVKNETNTDWAAISILAHEVGHHLQGHTIQAGGSRPTIELEADRYSGYVLFRMGATLAQAQAAMNAIGSDTGSTTHPAKSARLAAITNGWVAARDQAVLPSGPVKSEPQPQAPEQGPLMPTSGPMPQTGPIANPGSATLTFVSRVLFPGDPTAYFVTSTDDIVARAPNGVIALVGRKTPPTLPGFAWMYSTAAITYGVLPTGEVVNRNQFGAIYQIGLVTAP